MWKKSLRLWKTLWKLWETLISKGVFKKVSKKGCGKPKILAILKFTIKAEQFAASN